MKRFILYYSAIGFALNFIWEASQFGFFEPHFQGVADFLLVHAKAALGDVALLLIIYFITTVVFGNKKWWQENKVAPFIFMIILGFIFAIGIEKYSLLTHRWAYDELMPIIPIIRVGLVPVLQQIIIVPLSVFLTKRYFLESRN